MSKADIIEVNGVVSEALPNALFKVKLGNGHTVLAYISGKLRTNFIKIITGDTVRLEMSPYDLTKGRIIWRENNNANKANQSGSSSSGTNVVASNNSNDQTSVSKGNFNEKIANKSQENKNQTR